MPTWGANMTAMKKAKKKKKKKEEEKTRSHEGGRNGRVGRKDECSRLYQVNQ